MKTSEDQAAPSAPAILSTAHVCRMPLEDLLPSPQNPRRIDDSDPSLVELANSLATLGQIEPIVVRKVEIGGWKDGDEGGKLYDYRILAGERRWRASRIAGLTGIECKVITCDDRTALEITVVENLQRQDLHPMDEARGVRALLDGGWDQAEIAAHLGKTQSWVSLRAQLTKLAASWTDAIAKGKLAWAKVAHLEQVARLPVNVQDELAKRYVDDRWETPSTTQLAEEIRSKYLHQLSSAPWKLDDADLVPASGACAGCCKRSDLQQMLFSDVAGKARCLDAVCWAGKVQAQTARQAVALKEKHAAVVVLADSRQDAEAPKQLPQGVTVVHESYNLRECKKGDAGALPVVHADTGRITYAKVSDYAPAEMKKALGAPIKAPKPGAKTAADASGQSAKIAQLRRQAQRYRWRFEQIIEAMDDVDCPKVDVLLRLVALLLVDHMHVRDSETWEAIASTKRTQADDLDTIWGALREHFDAHIGGQVISSQLPDLDAVQEIERLMMLDPTEQGEKALRQIPEPEPKRKAQAKGQKPGSGKVAKPKAVKATKPAKATKGKRGAA